MIVELLMFAQATTSQSSQQVRPGEAAAHTLDIIAVGGERRYQEIQAAAKQCEDGNEKGQRLSWSCELWRNGYELGLAEGRRAAIDEIQHPRPHLPIH